VAKSYILSEQDRTRLREISKRVLGEPDQQIARQGPRLHDEPRAQRWWLSSIRGWEALPTVARWKYAHQEVEIDPADGLVDVSGGESGTTTEDYALNLQEFNNIAPRTGTQGTSVNETRPDYLDTSFNLMPVGGGSAGTPANQVLVWMTKWFRNDDTSVYLFKDPSAHDGDC
jgi:hypothetical protein